MMTAAAKPHRAPSARRFQAALTAHGTVRGACDACGISLQAVLARRADGSPSHPDLLAILNAYAAQRSGGAKVIVRVHLPPATLARLDRFVAGREGLGRYRQSRSAVARDMVTAALKGPLPEPLPEAGDEVALSLGDAWRALVAVAEDSPGVLRAVLARQEIDR